MEEVRHTGGIVSCEMVLFLRSGGRIKLTINITDRAKLAVRDWEFTRQLIERLHDYDIQEALDARESDEGVK